jgi:hypothetical protein
MHVVQHCAMLQNGLLVMYILLCTCRTPCTNRSRWSVWSRHGVVDHQSGLCTDSQCESHGAPELVLAQCRNHLVS